MARTLFILANLTFVITSTALPEIVVPNGDFEDYNSSNDGWADWEYDNLPPSGVFEYEEFDTWEMYGALRITAADPGDYYLYQDISTSGFEDGETYLLTAKVKTSFTIDEAPDIAEANAYLSIKPTSDPGFPCCTHPIDSTQEWTLVQVPFVFSDSGSPYRIEVGLYDINCIGADSKCEAWFDDIRIIRIGNTLGNPDFERWVLDNGLMLNGWETGGNGTATYLYAEGLTGSRSLEIEAKSGENYRYQNIYIGTDPDGLQIYRDYRFSVYTKDASGSAPSFIEAAPNGGIAIREQITATTKWEPIELMLNAGNFTDYQFRVGIDGVGTANFDRARLEQLTVSDGDFGLAQLGGDYPWQTGGLGGSAIIDNNRFKIVHGVPADSKHGYQIIELMKGCGYRIRWDAELAGLNDGDKGLIEVISGIGTDTETTHFIRYFTTGPSGDTFDGFFSVPSVDLDENDAVTARVYLRLDGTGTLFYDDVTIEKISERQDLNPVTIVPQPQAVMDLGFDTAAISGSDDWQIYYYQNPATLYEYGFDVMAQRFADNLAFEFDVGGAIIGNEREPLDVSVLTGSSPSNAIVIGEYNPAAISDFNTLVGNLGGVSEYVMDNPEGYEMFVEQDLIVIAASDTAGAQYGAETLLQYLKEIPTRQHEQEPANEDRIATVPCGHIYDWPDYPWRAVWMVFFRGAPYDSSTGDYRLITTDDDDPKLLRSYIDYFKFLASMKINRVYFNCDFYALEESAPDPGEMGIAGTEYYDELVKYGFPPTEPKGGYRTYHYFSAFFEMCRAYHIEPIPIAGGYSHAQVGMLEYLPTMVEGQYIGEDSGLLNPAPKGAEVAELDDDIEYVLGGRFVIISHEGMQGDGVDWFRTDVEVYEFDGEVEIPLTEGQDYVLDYVEPGFYRENNAGYPWGWYMDWESSPWLNPFDENDEFINARIRFNTPYTGTLHLKYNHAFPLTIEEKRFNASPAAVEYKVYVETLFDRIFHRLSPLKYVFNRHGEIFQMSTDGRSLAYAGTEYPNLNKNANLYLKSVWFNYDTIQAKNDLYNSINPANDVRVIEWDDPIIRSHDNLKGNPLTNHHWGQMGGGEGDISEPMGQIQGEPPGTYDSAFEYLPEDTIIGCWNFSVEHLYHNGEVVGPPGDTETLDFDVEVSDWIKYRYLEEITRGEYYEAYEPADFTSPNRKYHQRRYDAVFHLRATAGTYYGPWYTNPKNNDADEDIKMLARKSQFKPYNEMTGGVTVGVDYFNAGTRIYTDEMEYNNVEKYLGRDGRAWVYSMLEGSHYGVPWGMEDEGDDPDDEWHLGWRNLEVDVALRYYPDMSYRTLDAQYYLRLNGAVRNKNMLKWGELPDAPFNGDKVLPDPAYFFKDEQWPGAAGIAWLDNAFFEETDGTPTYIDKDTNNGGFENLTSFWDFGNISSNIRKTVSDASYNETGHSGLLERYNNPNPLTYGALNHGPLIGINTYFGFGSGNKIKLGGRLRTKLVDCQRMHNPWQWYLSGLQLNDDYANDEDDGQILGPLNEMMGKTVFPGGFKFKPEWRIWFKYQISDINVAEWGWSVRKPYVSDNPDTNNNREDVWETPKLYNFWYRPVYLFESESVRHEKKAIIEEEITQ